MTETTNFSELIINISNLFPEGKKTFKKDSGNWELEVFAEWNTKNIDLIINSRNSNLKEDFTYCSLKKALLISLIARYKNFKISGQSSPVSDLLLQSPLSQNLLQSRRATFKLDGKNVVYESRIRKKDKNSLTNTFTLFNLLLLEIELVLENERIKST